MKNKLTFRLTVSIVLTLMLLAGIMTPVYLKVQHAAYERIEERRVAEFAAGLMALEPFRRQTVADYYAAAGVSYRLYVFDGDFQPLYASLELGNRANILQRLFGDKLDRFTPDAEPVYSVADNEGAVRLSTVRQADGKLYYIQIKDGFDGVDPVFGFTNRILIYVVIAYVLICSAALVLTLAPAVRSIRQTTAVAARIAGGDMTARSGGPFRRDETGELAQSVNRMADTIQEQVDGLRNYNFLLTERIRSMHEYDDVRKSVIRSLTHDLKTPLAVISSQVEMMYDCADAEKRDFYYRSAMEEVERMSRMISQVLHLTLEGQQPPEEAAEPTDVSALVRRLCDGLRGYAGSKGIGLDAAVEPGVRLKLVPGQVEHVLRNYLSNAVQNAEPSSRVSVQLRGVGRCARLSVFDKGPGIPEALSDRIWLESFTTRPDDRVENSGLGLFIVRQIAQKQGAECGFFNRDGGVEFWFDFRGAEERG